MKLIKANFKNFRLLKDLTLNFSSSKEKKLTVIRAANETGKTTCLYGLMWGLFGSSKTIDKDYVISPKDVVTDKTTSIDIEVDIEFSQLAYTNNRGGVASEERQYRIKRSCQEIWQKKVFVERTKDRISLYEIKSNGSTKLGEAEALKILDDGLPSSLKNVYFTDGDSALAFIEADAGQAAKRRRVSVAIESLLGMEILRQATKHLNTVATKFNAELDKTDNDVRYTEYTDLINGFEEDIEESEEELKKAQDKLTITTSELDKTNKKIEELLKLGDKQKLSAALKAEKDNLRRTQDNADRALKDLAKHCGRSESLSQAMLKKSTDIGLKILRDLGEKKQLPKLNIPILEELLENNKCFCQEDLSEGTKKRKIIEESIENSRESDAIQDAATSLYFSTRSKNFEEASNIWIETYSSLSQTYFNLTSTIKEIAAKIKQLETDVDQIDDSNLQEYRDMARGLNNTKTNLIEEISSLTFKIKDFGERKTRAETERKKIEGKIGKTNNTGRYIELSRHSKDVFENIINKLKKEELKKVSDQLNDIFLKMIGSSPDDNSLTVITKAELTEDYDIVVYGPQGNRLDPDNDLNGASRRAITLSFILALTKVSEVEAPNVIDTPLGMMAGYVKQSVLENTIKQGSQTVLFLTHDEINGVESIIKKYAGQIYTLTSPAHYPKMLVNKPDIDDLRILRCECDHTSSCHICERKNLEE